MRGFPFSFVHDLDVVTAPVGQPCMMCGQPIEEGDLGFMIPLVVWPGRFDSDRPWHRICLLVSGGLPEHEIEPQREGEEKLKAAWQAACLLAGPDEAKP